MIYCCCHVLPTAHDVAVMGGRRPNRCQGAVNVLLTAFDTVVRGSRRHAVEVDGRVLTKALDYAKGQQEACRSGRTSINTHRAQRTVRYMRNSRPPENPPSKNTQERNTRGSRIYIESNCTRVTHILSQDCTV